MPQSTIPQVLPYPTPSELKALYAAREVALARLNDKESIEPADLNALDRLGRFRVVTELWGKCPAPTQSLLVNDPHPHVRSAARIAARQQNILSGEEIVQLMRKHRVTIRSLALRMNITLKRVREVRQKGVSGRCFCQDWREGITATGIFARKAA